MKILCTGIFETVSSARNAIQELIDVGLDRDSISAVTSRDRVLDPRVDEVEPAGSHTAEAATAGSVLGGVLGAAAGTTAVVASGGTGLLVLGPMLMAAGAVGGGFIGAMATRGVEPAVADFYDQALTEGQILVAVDLDDPSQRDKVNAVLERNGARTMPLPKE